MLKICIDARLWGTKHTGIGRYTENLISHFNLEQQKHLILIVSPPDYDHPDLKQFVRHKAYFHPYQVLAQFEMLFLYFRIRPQLLHATHSSIPIFWPGKIVVTFHDLIRHLSKGKDTTTKKHFLYQFKYYGYLLIDYIALKKAVKIIVPSNYWRTYLTREYHLPEEKVVVTYEGVDPRIKSSTKTHFFLPKPFLVYTGNLYPHKNILILFQALKILPSTLNLALVCSRSVFTLRAKKLVSQYSLNHRVFFLGSLTDEQMADLYSQASAFVFPSLIEGFGLPGLEAMSQKLPVIAANSSCLPEVYGQAAIYFNPKSPSDLAYKILKLQSSPDMRQKFIRAGIIQYKLYSWSKMSQQTWQIYLSVLH